MSDLVQRRPDLKQLSGYHSPLVQVEVRLNVNESPERPPEDWVADVQNIVAGTDFNRYPDRDATALRSALAAHHGVQIEQIFAANGSNEVIQTLLLAYGGPGRKALVFEPTYTLHSHISMLTGTEVIRGQRSPDHELDLPGARALIEAQDPVITFLCSPNNPTGRAESLETIRQVLSWTRGLVLVDEAYGEFAETSAVELIHEGAEGSERLGVIHTFSKKWAMAGCRVGYLIAAPETVETCDLVALPYHLSSLTQAVGVTALKYEQEMLRRAEVIKLERARLYAAMSELPLDTWPSDANFILFRPKWTAARRVWEDLLAQSVLVRDCSSWPGLSGCLRVTVGSADENDRFLKALTASVSGSRQATIEGAR